MKRNHRKFFLNRLKAKSNSGIIILVVLWVLVILTLLAISLGRGTNIEITLAKHAVGKMKAKYMAWAGLVYAMEQIRKDSENSESSKLDTLYYCGIPTDQDTLESLFQKTPLRDGYFQIHYDATDFDTDDAELFGIQDEERFININTLTIQNVRAVVNLLELLGYERELAETIGYSIVDWRDADSNVSNSPSGAEDDYYMGLEKPYHCKNLPFDSKEELLLVQGVTQEIYNSMKDYVTVFPKEGNFRINMDTASSTVLQSVARYATEFSPTSDYNDADSLVDKMIEYRKGDDAEIFTSDDQQIEQSPLALNTSELALYAVLQQFRTKKSSYLRVKTKGVEENRDITSSIEAVIQRENLEIVYWHRN